MSAQFCQDRALNGLLPFFAVHALPTFFKYLMDAPFPKHATLSQAQSLMSSYLEGEIK